MSLSYHEGVRHKATLLLSQGSGLQVVLHSASVHILAELVDFNHVFLVHTADLPGS